MMPSPILGIHHVALRSADVSRLERFYAGLLGLAVLRRDPSRESVWLRISGGVLMLERAEPDEPPVPAGTRELLAFAVADREAWRSHFIGAGTLIESETPHTLYVRDPDGRRVAVSTFPLFDALL